MIILQGSAEKPAFLNDDFMIRLAKDWQGGIFIDNNLGLFTYEVITVYYVIANTNKTG